MNRQRGYLLALVLLAVLCINSCVPLVVGAAGGAVGGAVTSAKESEKESYSTGTYIGTVLGNAVYFPAKVIFALGGSVVAGVSYIVTGADPRVSGPIWDASTGGNYILTPAMIAGQRPIQFSGS